MTMVSIVPTDRRHWLELKKTVVSSTEVSALFGLNNWLSAFELWHTKKTQEILELEPNARMTWGTRLESKIAEGVAEDNGLNIRKMDEFIYDPDLKIGSSFDYAIDDDGLLECKNVDFVIFKKFWSPDGDSFEMPLYIEMQVQNELFVSGRKYAIVAALIGGNDVKLIRRERDESVIKAIKEKVKGFWESIASNTEPEVDFSKDSQFISKLYGYSEPGKYLDESGNETLSSLAGLYDTALQAENEAKKTKERIKGEILRVIQDAEKVEGAGFKISAGMVPPTPVPAHLRKGYRRFQITWGKENG